MLLTGVSEGATYNFGSVPTASCSTTDALSGVATQATLSLSGGNGDGSGNFTATCSGASDLAGNSAAPVSVTYTVNPPADSTALTAWAAVAVGRGPHRVPRDRTPGVERTTTQERPLYVGLHDRGHPQRRPRRA